MKLALAVGSCISFAALLVLLAEFKALYREVMSADDAEEHRLNMRNRLGAIAVCAAVLVATSAAVITLAWQGAI